LLILFNRDISIPCQVLKPSNRQRSVGVFNDLCPVCKVFDGSQWIQLT
jgi:hypothetical protein